MNPFVWSCGRFQLGLERPLLMGILNVTPDSFYDGSQHNSLERALEHAHLLIEQGADIIDIGGESTRPGAEPVPLDQELERVVPLVEQLHKLNIPLSVDTFKPPVMQAVLQAGADIINDIYALRMPGAVQAVANTSAGLCVMHMQGEPRTMQEQPDYQDVCLEVRQFLQERAQVLREAGIAPERICLDPGFGFGKTVAQNYDLLRGLQTCQIDSYPLLIGLSRKSMLGHITGKPPEDRLIASVAAALVCVERGAKILRVHDVAATREALQVWNAVVHGV